MDPRDRRATMLDDLIERVGGFEALDQLNDDPIPDEPFDWTDVADEDHAFVADVLTLADRCCDELLDSEFRTIARRILARLVLAEPRALRRSPNRARLAAGLIWLTGNANGLFEKRSRIKADAVWSRFGVSSCADRGRTIRSAASLMLSEDVPLKTVQDTLGHSTIRLTADLYGHLMPGDDQRVADAMDRALGG